MRYRVFRTYEVKVVVETIVDAESPEQASELTAENLDKKADEIDLQEELTMQEEVEEV